MINDHIFSVSTHGQPRYAVLVTHELAKLALCHDEVRILIFDDPAELAKRKRPVMVRSGRGPFKPARPRRGRAMHEFFFEKLRNPAHNRRAGLMRQFRTNQVYSRASRSRQDHRNQNSDFVMT
jgi:hypothetical protein